MQPWAFANNQFLGASVFLRQMLRGDLVRAEMLNTSGQEHMEGGKMEGDGIDVGNLVSLSNLLTFVCLGF